MFDNAAATDELNAFLRGQKVLTIDKQQVMVDGQAFWTFCLTYLPQTSCGNTAHSQQRAAKVDYKEVLDLETFAVFSQLRSIRKQIAEQEAIPAYAVFTDSELAEIAKLENIEPSLLQTIQGIGQKRVEKYGIPLCEKYKETNCDVHG